MKILFVYQFCTLGGVEAVLRNRLSEFTKRGISPEVVFLDDHGGKRIFEGFKNIHFESRESELLRLIEAREFDFIIPIDTPQIYPIVKKSHFKGILVTEVHTSNLDILQYLSGIGQTETQAIITPSRFEKDLICREIKGFERTGIPIHIVPNPINQELFQFKEPKGKSSKKVIGWVGRLEKGKNWKQFLEIASFLSRKREDLLFLIIGGNYAEERIKMDFFASIKRLDLVDHLKWIPYMEYDRMPHAYSLMAGSGGCFVATSLRESFGITVIEAMACRCPVVASRAEAFEEVIEDGKNGFLFEVNDTPEALAKIEALLDDHSMRASLVRDGWLTVNENYSSPEIVHLYLEVLQGLSNRVAI